MNTQNMKKITTIGLILLMTFSAVAAIMPATSAHTPAWTIPTYAYIVASPDRIGTGQTMALVFWLNWVPPGSGGVAGDRWRNLTVEVTAPNGAKQTLGPFISDPIGGGYSAFTPDQVGTYRFVFNFPGQVPSMYGPTGIISVNNALWDYINDTFQPSRAETTLTVQQLPIGLTPDYPLPTNYWTRPIDGQNVAWASIASNWLGNEPGVTYNVQPIGIAPNTPHIMWTKPLQDGGVVGGTYPGVAYYEGDSYEMRFNSPMIIHGRLYYPLPLGHAQYGGGYIAVDLRTGEQIWWQNWTSALPGFGQIYEYETINQHGVLPTGMLWRVTGTTWNAYDSLTGNWLYALTDVPSGNNYYGITGDITRYVIGGGNRWMALWNDTQHNVGLEISTDEFGGVSANALQWRPNGKTVNMSKAYSWNVTLSTPLPAGSTINYVNPEDILLCNTPVQFFGGNAAFGTIPFTVTAISLKPATRGQILWSKQYSPPPGNITRFIGPVDPVNRIFTTVDKETMQWSGYSIDNGNLVWGPVGSSLRGYAFYDSRSGAAGSSCSIYQGKLFVGGFNGIVYCYDTKNGNLLWVYGTGGAGNSTFAGLENVWGYYPTFLGAFADGKVYTFTEEHSVNTPIYKGALIRCLNASTGKEIWTLPGFASSTSFYSRLGAIADGYLSYFNCYDGQIYTLGKGPSALTVSAPQVAVPRGAQVLIQGTVTDQSAGAKQKMADGAFSNVPAVSDESMSAWMQYVYMQKPKPTNATGVRVHLTATDPNGNYQDVGYAVSNSLGNFAFAWTPPVTGLYTISAKFEGSESYFASEAGTSFIVSEAAASAAPIVTPSPTPIQTTEPTPTTPAPVISPSPSPAVTPPASPTPTATYVIIGAAVVVIVLAVAAVLVLKRRK
jgi:hypothetical protein